MRLLLVAPLAIALLAGCSSGGHEVTPPKDETGAYRILATAGNEFSPEHASVPAGAKVTWLSKTTHDVVAEDGSFRSEYLKPDETFSHTFATPGDYEYHCTLHSGMTGVIHVTEA